MKKIIIFVLCLFLICARYPSCLFALGQDFILLLLEQLSPCIVSIKAENAALAQTPQSGVVIDKNTGRMLVVKRVMAAQYNRTGSGVIIDPSGIIATNAHTIVRSGRVKIVLADGSEFQAEILLVVPEDDIALLKIQCEQALPAVELADSNQVSLGETVYTVGSSEALKGTVSSGTVTGLGTKKEFQDKSEKPIEMIRTSFSIYKGDSGGPLFNTEGKLLGLISAAQTDVSHVSFAIPANKIKQHFTDLAKEHPSFSLDKDK